MYAYLKGILISYNSTHVTVELNGIGYYISIPCSTLDRLPAIGQPIQLYTSFVVRELSHSMYGFITGQERDVFEVLQNVSGIGPKLALSIIGHLTLEKLFEAIQNANLNILSKVPGIGKKTAERMVIELRDKLSNLSSSGMADYAISISKDPLMQKLQDAVLALVNLGYNQSAAQKAVKAGIRELPEEYNLSDLITASLKNV